MITMNGEDGDGDVQVWILVIHSREPDDQLIAVLLVPAYENPGALPSIGSLISSN